MINKTPLESWILRKTGGGDSGTNLTAQTLESYQLERLRETIDYVCSKSPFYRRQLACFSADRMTHLSNLGRLPFTTADDLRRDPLSFLCVTQDKITRVVTLRTSGTTGDSKRLFFTREDIELTIDFFSQGMSTLVTAGQRVLILLPGDKPDSVGDLLARGLKRIDVEGVIHGPIRNHQAVADEIVNRKIDCLVGIPAQVFALAHSRAGSIIKPGMIRSVLLSTDYVPQSIVKELKRLWGCPVYNHYGMTEMGLGGGVECEALSGYHLREADLYFELVNPRTGEFVRDGERGEIVFTTLTRKGMPLIRYRTGDMASFIKEPCPCGTVLRRMERVRGRWDGRVYLGHTSVLTLQEIDEILFSLPWLLNYSAEMSVQDGKDCLEITVYTESEEDAEEHEVLSLLQQHKAINDAIKEGFLCLAPIKFSRENEFTTGVAKRQIIDRRLVS